MPLNPYKVLNQYKKTLYQPIQEGKQGNAGFDNPRDNIDPKVMMKPSAPVKNDVIMYNGNNWVPTPEGTTFSFSISSFSDAITGPVEIATGVYKAVGAISFTAAYSNGPAVATPYISCTGWTNLNMTGTDYVGPTLNAEALNFPSVGTAISFTLNATDGTDADTATESIYFYNKRHWGVSATASGYTSANIGNLANNELSNSRAKTFTITAAAGEYIIYAHPSRLGTSTFTVAGWEGGFQSPETVSRTNDSGYVENYYVYRSDNSGLGAVTVVVT